MVSCVPQSTVPAGTKVTITKIAPMDHSCSTYGRRELKLLMFLSEAGMSEIVSVATDPITVALTLLYRSSPFWISSNLRWRLSKRFTVGIGCISLTAQLIRAFSVIQELMEMDMHRVIRTQFIRRPRPVFHLPDSAFT